MTAALDLLESVGGGRKIAILGDMLEMGEYGPAAHLEVGRYAQNKADILVAIGPLAAISNKVGMKLQPHRTIYRHGFPTNKAPQSPVLETIRPENAYLVKASRVLNSKAG